MEHILYTQLMARCTYNASTGKVKYENFRSYYTKKKGKGK